LLLLEMNLYKFISNNNKYFILLLKSIYLYFYIMNNALITLYKVINTLNVYINVYWNDNLAVFSFYKFHKFYKFMRKIYKRSKKFIIKDSIYFVKKYS